MNFYFHRLRIGPNIDFKGNGLTMKLSKEYQRSFIYVCEEQRVDNYVYVFNKYDRDFDILNESPGKSIYTDSQR